MSRRPTPLAAVLQGKLGIVKHHEDFTTAMVFGVLAWLPYPLGVQPLLRLAGLDEGLLDSVGDVSVELWPWWDHDPNGKGAEPDVVVTLVDDEAHEHLVVIEAKRRSGLGPRQLERQANNALRLSNSDNRSAAAVVFLTEHRGRPPEALDRGHVDGIPLLSLSWCDLQPILEAAAASSNGAPMARAMASDAAAVLRRWGLIRFQGIDAVQPAVGWSFPTHPQVKR